MDCLWHGVLVYAQVEDSFNSARLIPALVFVAYIGFAWLMTGSLDWNSIQQEVFGMKGFTADDLDVTNLWN